MAISKFLTLSSGIQDLVSGQQTSSGAAAGAIVALNSSSFVDTSIGGTGLDSSSAADGDLLIGNGSGFTLAALTAGANITITPGAGTLEIAASGGGSFSLTPVSESASFTGAVGNFYQVTLSSANITLTYPSASANSGLFFAVQLVGGGGGSFRVVLGVTVPINLYNNGDLVLLLSDGTTWNIASYTPGVGLSPSNGQILIGDSFNHSYDPGEITSSGSTITVTNGEGSINIDVNAPLTVPNGGTGHTTLTTHDLLVGAGASNVTLVAPSATAGVPLVSGGSSADPSYTTAVVAGGGTGQTSLTAHAVLLGEGTSGVGTATIGTAGRVLTDNGSGSDPTFQAPTATPNTLQVVASANISAGAAVNLYNNSGTLNVRPADNTSSSTPAHGFAPAAISSSATGTVVPFAGPVTGLSGLTVGSQYFLGTAGSYTATSPSSSGDVIQTLGIATSSSTLQFFAGTVNNIA